MAESKGLRPSSTLLQNALHDLVLDLAEYDCSIVQFQVCPPWVFASIAELPLVARRPSSNEASHHLAKISGCLGMDVTEFCVADIPPELHWCMPNQMAVHPFSS